MFRSFLVDRDILFSKALGVLRSDPGKEGVHARMSAHAFSAVIKLGENRKLAAMLLQLPDQFGGRVITSSLLREEQLGHEAKVCAHTYHPHRWLRRFAGTHNIEMRQRNQGAADSAEEGAAIQGCIGFDEHIRIGFGNFVTQD